jgi:hypothetical protein
MALLQEHRSPTAIKFGDRRKRISETYYIKSNGSSEF